MTVTVTLPDGGTDEYMRFGDSYHENGDGTLDVIRTGAKEPQATRESSRSVASGVDVSRRRYPGSSIRAAYAVNSSTNPVGNRNVPFRVRRRKPDAARADSGLPGYVRNSANGSRACHSGHGPTPAACTTPSRSAHAARRGHLALTHGWSPDAP